jgi:PAS domain S-box-containing protein
MNYRKKHIRLLMGVFTVLTSSVVLVAFFFHLPFLQSGWFGMSFVKFNTALCFLLLGICLLLLQNDNRKVKWAVPILASIVITAGLLTLFEYIFNRNIGIDEWLWKEGPGTAKPVYPGRISIPASLGFILTGMAVFLVRNSRAAIFVWLALIAVFLIASLAFMGYIFGIPHLLSSLSFSNMALLTSVLFMAICIGIYYSEQMRHALISFWQKLVVGFTLIGLVMVIVFYIYNKNDQDFINTAKWVEHTNSVLYRSEEMLSTLTATESGVRGYALTNDPQLISSLEMQKEKTFLYLNEIRKLTSDNLLQQKRIDTLSGLVTKRFIVLDETVALRKKKGYSEQQFLVFVREGLFTMNGIRNMLTLIKQDESLLLNERTSANLEKVENARRIIYFFGFVIFIILIILLSVISRNINTIMKDEQEIRSLNENLEKKIVERTTELMRTEHKFQTIIESSSDLISLTDKNFHTTYRSPSAERITGWTATEREKGSITELTHPDDLPAFRKAVQACIDQPGKPVYMSFRVMHKKGHYVWLEGTATNMLQDESLQAIVTNFQDITLRKESEEKLARSEAAYRTIASSIPGTVICLFDTDYRYTLIEGDMLEKIGYSKQALMGKTIEEVLPPNRYPLVQSYFKRVFEEGESFRVDESRTGVDTISQYVPLKDENGHVYAAMVVLFDVSELKSAQRAITELNHGLEDKIKERTAQLAAANKELESFSYSVSHDLRAPLRGIDGWSLALLEDYGDQLDEKAHQYLGRVRHETQRMGELIDDMLKLSRVSRAEVKLSLVDISALSEMIVERIRFDYKNRIIAFDITPGLLVFGDANLIEIMLTNLISNACKFTGKTAQAEIAIGKKIINGTETFFIKDNGAGFNMENAKNLFGAFQRMHRQSEFPGSGIGLATVQRIVHLHKGTIWAEAAVNQGATFYFMIPNKTV